MLMRQLLFLALLPVLLSSPVLAQRATGVLRVRFDDRSPAVVAVNGRHFQKSGRAFTIGDLPRGRSYVKVYAFRAYRDGGGGHARLVYEGKVRIHPGIVTYCIVERNTGRVLIYFRDPGGAGSYHDPDFDDPAAAPETVAPATRESGPAATDKRRTPGAPGRQTLSAADIKELEKQVNGHIADEDKLRLMQELLEELSVSTAQVKEMLSWLGAETTRLEFAIWAYGRVTDPQQYHQLTAAFIYDSSKETLSSYINGTQ